MRKTMLTALIAMMLLLVAAIAYAKEDNLLSFEVSPNPMDKECTISLVFQATNTTPINVVVETLGGELVRNIYSGYCEKVLILNWDRLGNNGQYAPNGTYFVTVSTGNRYTSTKKTVILK